MKYVALAGRQLFSILFIVASAGHFNQETIEAAAATVFPSRAFWSRCRA